MKAFLIQEHGARLSVQTPNSRMSNRLCQRLLMPGWQKRPWEGEEAYFEIRPKGRQFELLEMGKIISMGRVKELLPYLVSQFHHQLATDANDIFVHAGCVEVDGQAVLLPGRSFSGKSTLTAALVAAGAGYLSDEYAIFDRRSGLVRPFPRPIHLRQAKPDWLESLSPFPRPEHFQGLPLGAVVQLKYQQESQWEGAPCSPGQAALHLFDNTVAARRLGAEALRIFATSLIGKRYWQGQRGCAEDAAPRLLSWLRE